jgi:hypothetical protein
MGFAVSYVHAFKHYHALVRANYERRPFFWARQILLALPAAVLMRIFLQGEPLMPDLSGIPFSSQLCEMLHHPLFIILVAMAVIRAFFPYLSFRLKGDAGKRLGSSADESEVSYLGGDGIKSHYPWKACSSATKLKDASAIVIWTGRMEGIVLPTEGFSNHAAFDAAWTFIQEKLATRKD